VISIGIGRAAKNQIKFQIKIEGLIMVRFALHLLLEQPHDLVASILSTKDEGVMPNSPFSFFKRVDKSLTPKSRTTDDETTSHARSSSPVTVRDLNICSSTPSSRSTPHALTPVVSRSITDENSQPADAVILHSSHVDEDELAEELVMEKKLQRAATLVKIKSDYRKRAATISNLTVGDATIPLASPAIVDNDRRGSDSSFSTVMTSDFPPCYFLSRTRKGGIKVARRKEIAAEIQSVLDLSVQLISESLGLSFSASICHFSHDIR
jgi:hypothetical protein